MHPTKTEKADDIVARHLGGMISPPVCDEGGREERLKMMGAWEDHVFTIHGKGWKEAAADVSLLGLGWFSVTGAGDAKIRVRAPEGAGVRLREESLMPFDVWRHTGR